jgi:hypothetical protein
MNRGPDFAALNRRIAASAVPGDQEDHALVRCYGALKAEVDRGPGPVKILSVKVDHPVGPDIART